MFYFILLFWGIYYFLFLLGEFLNFIGLNVCLCLEGFWGKWKDLKIFFSKLNLLLFFVFFLNNFLDLCMYCFIVLCEEIYNFNNGCCVFGIYFENFLYVYLYILYGWFCNDLGCVLFIINVNIGFIVLFYKMEIILV